MRCPLVAQMFVHGDSLQSYLLGVAVPDPDEAAAWAAKNGLAGADVPTLVREHGPKLHDALLAQIVEQCKAAKLAGFEVVRRLVIEPEAWTPESGLLTPTFKLKRNDVKKKYAAALEELYKLGPPEQRGSSKL